ncbi:TetR/AcrR family transcriptional regulator [Parasphingorhabdus sp.]|uniref:TetR/AcrR family transcriptional regulator n=1 Tax=Parasphingorhabdus sp. TaxID=2709688 RepID=UPI003265C99D
MAGRTSRSESTQARIINVARDIFAREGFAGASLAEIVNTADVTTGAIYHHYGDKRGLFKAVAESLEKEILDEVAKLPPQSDPWNAFESGIAVTLEICIRPDIQRIVFQDAPNVIGLAEWREIEVQYAFGVMRNAVSELSAAGVIDEPDADLAAQTVLGAIIQAAHGIATAKNQATALAHAQATVKRMVRGLRSVKPTQP